MVAATYELDDGIARITLARPEIGNAVDLDLARALMHATIEASEDDAVRVVLLRGAGPRFCVGGDLGRFAADADLPRYIKEVTTYLHAAISRLSGMDAPVVAAVQGSAAGAGLSLAAACDIVLAAASAKFVMAYPAVGLSPDGSATWFLPRVLGLRRALELALLNRTLTAGEAEAWGLVTRVVPDDELDAQAEETARTLALGPTRALGRAKRLLRGSLGESLETQMELETRALCDSARGDDGSEGIAAFLAKRPPRFTGG